MYPYYLSIFWVYWSKDLARYLYTSLNNVKYLQLPSLSKYINYYKLIERDKDTTQPKMDIEHVQI